MTMRDDPWVKIGAAMVGPGLIGQPGRVEQKTGALGKMGEITGISIERNAYPTVSIDGAPHSLDEWDVWVNVPPDVRPSLAARLGSPDGGIYAVAAANMEAAAATPRAAASIRFERRLDETPLEGLRRHIGETGGAISTCWSNLEGAGTFDSTRAKELTEELLAAIADTFGIRFP